jgi:hypothetical protein
MSRCALEDDADALCFFLNSFARTIVLMKNHIKHFSF